MTTIKVTGGARIGMANVSWPFASLTINKYKLALNATILGNLVFKPGDIVSIKPNSGLISSGLKINHIVPNYNNKIIFWSFNNPGLLIKKIEQTRFLNNTDPIGSELENNIEIIQSKGGFPIKTSAVIFIIVIWNIFYLMAFLNFFGSGKIDSPERLGAQMALGFILLTSILLLTFKQARHLILKKGKDINDIKKFVFFIMFISGFMLLTLMRF
jgi:hypothetical protein